MGLYHLGLKVGETDDELRAALAELQAEGVTVVGASDHTVTHSLYIQDPDGNELELYIDVQPEVWRDDPSAVMAPVRAAPHLTHASAAGPEQDALEGVEVRAAVAELVHEPLAVPVDELVEELGREPLLEAREARALHPLDHVGTRLEMVRVDLEAHVLLGEPDRVEQLGVLLGLGDAEHRVGRGRAAERVEERLLVRDLARTADATRDPRSSASAPRVARRSVSAAAHRASTAG